MISQGLFTSKSEGEVLLTLWRFLPFLQPHQASVVFLRHKNHSFMTAPPCG